MDGQQLCLNCGEPCPRPNSATFHCHRCTHGLANFEKNEQIMPWLETTANLHRSVVSGQQINTPWPEGYPCHLSLR